MAMNAEQFAAAKSEAARKAAATKVAGREIKKCIEQVCRVAQTRLLAWSSAVEARTGTQPDDRDVQSTWVHQNQWVLGWDSADFDMATGVGLVKRRLIQAAQAFSPDVQIRRRNGGLVFEAKVTLEGIQSAAQQVLGEGWQGELPVPRPRRRRRSN